MAKKILFVASEAAPFVASGGLGDVIGALPAAIMNKSDMDVRVVLPFYRDISEKHMSEIEYLCYTYVSLGWRNQYCGIFRTKYKNVTFYFIDNEYYFKREGCYGHFDDGERFAYFCKSALEILPVIDFFPDVIHAHDWQSALVPIYLRTLFGDNEKYRRIRTAFTIHNIEYQGKFDLSILGDVFALAPYHGGIVEWNGCINLMKGAIEVCDKLLTVSPTYAAEIFSPFYSHGLSPIIEKNSGKLGGILNGIDFETYNPKTDMSVFCQFDARSFKEGKLENKLRLQRQFGLVENADIPLIAVISRLVNHKGMDILAGAADEIINRGAQLAVLGTGDYTYEDFFYHLAQRHPCMVSTNLMFNPDTARKIYAASDMFLMPSKSEPCGLAQMIASRYGSVPIVRETGGLYDSIHDCSFGHGNGFTFSGYTSDDIINAVDRAKALYYNKENWHALVNEVMTTDFSWDKSAGHYINTYKEI
ncbi:MAG: glycogen synthase [Clostridia bacterium]|nr:glycogen synthase [Clostridia bacterium]